MNTSLYLGQEVISNTSNHIRKVIRYYVGVITVRWLSIDGHSVDCHLGRMLLVCHLRRNVINVDTNVDCRLRRIEANSSFSDVLLHCYCSSHSYK